MIKDYLKVSYHNKTKPQRYADLEEKLAPIAQDMAFRWSHKGVPHLLAEVNNVIYSICYFSRYDLWRVFYPYQQDEQRKQDFNSIVKVIEFFTGVENNVTT